MCIRVCVFKVTNIEKKVASKKKKSWEIKFYTFIVDYVP